MKILNAFSGIGGNRELWGDKDITAIEYDEDTSIVYSYRFPNDRVLVCDAYDYIINHYHEYDFIWASPPCPSHSRMRWLWSGECNDDKKKSGRSMKLPDMKLYSLIIFLQNFYKGNWVVENVRSYYEPLIKPYEVSKHYFWSNKFISPYKPTSRGILSSERARMNDRKARKMLNNCVNGMVGLHVFNEVTKEVQKNLIMRYAGK